MYSSGRSVDRQPVVYSSVCVLAMSVRDSAASAASINFFYGAAAEKVDSVTGR